MKTSLFSYLMLDFISPIANSLHPRLGQTKLLNSHTKWLFSSDNQYYYGTPTRNTSDIFTLIRNLCRFLEPGQICSTKFDEKIVFLPPAIKEYINILEALTEN